LLPVIPRAQDAVGLDPGVNNLRIQRVNRQAVDSLPFQQEFNKPFSWFAAYSAGESIACGGNKNASVYRDLSSHGRDFRI